MTNPNDVAKVLNEMMNTLQELSKKELESVESIIQEQKKNLEIDKKTKDAKKELARIKKETTKTEEIIKLEEQKNLKSKHSLLSSLKESTSKIRKSSFRMSFDKSPTVKDLFSKVTIKAVQKNPPKVSNVISKSQSLLDFSRKEDKEDIQVEQLKVLREIDKKISDMSSVGSGSIFDFLSHGLGDFVSKTISSVLGVGAGASGGLLGGLGVKLGGKLGKVGKALKSVPKGKAGLIAGGAALVGMAGYGAYKFMSGSDDKDSETVEPRQFGGDSKVGKTYLVGEDGPELFSPKSNGVIIPNHKLPKVDKKVGLTDNLISYLETFRKGFQKNLGLLFSKFTTSFKDFGSTIWDKVSSVYDDIKNWVSGYIDGIKEKAKGVVESAKSMVGNIVDEIKSMIPKFGEDKSNIKQTPSIISPIDTKIINKYNPMSVPDINVPAQPITIENSYSQESPKEENSNDGLTKDFWRNDFIKAFSNSLVSRKSESKSKTVITSSVW